jgi:hypothetical protein
MLEKYFCSPLVELKRFFEISNYWNKKGEAAIDIVALNEIDKQLCFYKVERNKNRINIPLPEKNLTV